MKKFLNILSWSLLTSFLVPSGLILASWNAVPGDALYGVKVNLEKSLIKVTPSLALQSSLEVSYTERRLTETEQLLADAYKAQETILSLNNLDAQVAQAQYAIENVSDPTQKTALAERYIDTLARIASKLEENKQNLAAAPDIQTPTTAERVQQPIAQDGTQQTNVQQGGSQVAQTQIQTTKPETKTVVTTPTTSSLPTQTATQHVTVVSQIQITQATVNTTIINMQRLKRQIEQQSQSQSQGVRRGEGDKDKKEPEKKAADPVKTEGPKQEQNVEQKQTQYEQSNTETKANTPNTNAKSDTNVKSDRQK